MSIGGRLLHAISRYLNTNTSPEKSHLCDFERIMHEIRLCDVLLVEGRARVSHIIQSISRSPWTHAALYIGRISDTEDPLMRETLQKNYHGSPRDQLVIETIVGVGTIVSSLETFRKEHIRICRPSGLNYKDAQLVINFTIGHIGREYDIRQILDLARYYLGWFIIPKKWLSSLFHYKPSESKKDVCSVLIASAFSSIKFPIRPLIRENPNNQLEIIQRNPWLTAPCDFDYSPYFDIIKYPIMPTSHHAGYRSLPWNNQLISHDAEGVSRYPEDNEDNDDSSSPLSSHP